MTKKHRSNRTHNLIINTKVVHNALSPYRSTFIYETKSFLKTYHVQFSRTPHKHNIYGIYQEIAEELLRRQWPSIRKSRLRRRLGRRPEARGPSAQSTRVAAGAYRSNRQHPCQCGAAARIERPFHSAPHNEPPRRRKNTLGVPTTFHH